MPQCHRNTNLHRNALRMMCTKRKLQRSSVKPEGCNENNQIRYINIVRVHTLACIYVCVCGVCLTVPIIARASIRAEL